LTPRPWVRTYADDSLVHLLSVERDAEFTLCGRGLGDHRFVEGDVLPGDECAKCRARFDAGAEVLMAEVACA
jgi:hypothetical protein